MKSRSASGSLMATVFQLLLAVTLLSSQVVEARNVGSRRSLFERQSSPTAPATVSGWSSQGCYQESGANARALTGATYTDTTNMTIENCISFCSSKGFSYAGTEYMQECYCDNTIENGAGPAPASDCNMACKGNPNELCGGGYRLNLYYSGVKSAGPSTNPGPNGWGYIGCYTDNTGSRTLLNGVPIPGGGGNNSVANCVNACGAAGAGYTYAGVEYADECYCGTALSNGGSLAPMSSDGTYGCSMLCAGNSSEYCGGGNRLNVYQLGAQSILNSNSTSSSSSSIAQSSTSAPTSTSVSTAQQLSSTTSPSSIAYTCACTGQSSAPTSTSTVISTSVVVSTSIVTSTVVSTSTITTTTSQVARPSSSSSSLSLSSKASSSASLLSRTTSSSSSSKATLASSSSRSSSSSSKVVSSSSGSTSSKASTTTSVAGTSSSRPTASSTSSSSSSLQASSKSTSALTSSKASTSSAASSVTGTSSVSVSAAYSTSQSSTATSTMLTATSISSGVSSPTASPVSAYTYRGCWIDNANGPVMGGWAYAGSNNTQEYCINLCQSLNYTVAGMEYSSQCYCSNSINNGGVLAQQDSDCNMACAGNSSEMCGAGNRLSVFSPSNITAYPVPVAKTTNLPGGWTYNSCIVEAQNGRVFPHQIILSGTNSPQACLSMCGQYGYTAAGMEYGDECYCGDIANYINSGVATAASSDCNMVCPGDPYSVCGAGSRLSYYTWASNPPAQWSYASGNAAGQYQFLIGGVTVPLLTSLTITNKVVYLEKSGTGPPNNTGAYELDLAQLNNFTGAWRPMHVKTDVFCSAGLVLPDRAGRHLNIGGWSLASTFGVRLYWPDGSPGVWGVNDWQENVNELSLQQGRWYPSAMQLTNGSVLVVGGEAGSNGSPVPTLEILPQPAGGTPLFMDWLNRTDPYNLYPFLAVLPSGGIFVSYYNEARILDPNTFATTTVLPNLPGAVGHTDSGRTYPLEGTTVLLPQHAPYSDPLEVLICGGSSPGGQAVLDNCISIAPDQPSANWTLERMPSPRVMPCMAALPDGTYLIVNGAYVGVAGFGLASQPNLNALLYDPSKPIGQRITVMANTTVARLYHSEATLLYDGRVLISGSDPEDNTNPEEYRNEVFVPPYLLNGMQQPNYTIANTDWTYGQSFTITVVCPSGNISGMRASLLGAVTSTHGNSMGQRTLFPAFSCSGTTCTITAPPGSNIAPPGWYQLFVLDGPTPSYSQWVRIGGDPAALGNWPNYPDFNVPGTGAIHPQPQPVNGTTASNSTAGQ